MFDLKHAWNCNMRLKTAVSRASVEGISKEEVVRFWRASASTLGYSGSYPISKLKGNNITTRDELIRKYSTDTGMFGTYANWKGRSISYYLKKHGHAPLSDAEQKRYKSY